MKNFKIVRIILVFCMIMGSALAALDLKQDKEDETRKALEVAKKYIYEKNWEDAVSKLEEMVEKFEKSRYLDESLYWLGYSMEKLSRDLENMNQQVQFKEQAVKHLNKLIKEMDQSSWLNDAKVLRVEIAEELVKRGYSNYKEYINGSLGLGVLGGIEGGVSGGVEGGIGIGAEEDPERELKLVALDALMNMKDERAFSILKEVIDKNDDPRLRNKAIFIISQGHSPEVVPLLVKVAKSDPDEEVRKQAIFWLGQKKTKESLDALLELYDSVSDWELKKALIFSFF